MIPTAMMKVSMFASAFVLMSGKLILSTAGEYATSVETTAVDVGGGEPAEESEHDQNLEHRELRYARNKIHWPECVDVHIGCRLTVAQCVSLIEKELKRGHVLSNVKIEVKYPENRDISTGGQAKEYHNRVAVPVNYMAQAHGYFVDGMMTFKNKEWESSTTSAGSRAIGPWDCWGQDANQSSVKCCVH
jgi:hypothetical protein